MHPIRTLLSAPLMLLLLAGCEKDPLGYTYNQIFVEPRPWGIGDTPEGSPLFQKGWEEGCNSGMGMAGGRHYRKPAYKYQQDLSLINNEEYYRAWRDAFTYCRWYVNNWTKREYQGNALIY